MNQVKLVIWDLDETFWKGTLSEGAIEIVPYNVEFVKILLQRGIMCSISSKNDFNRAKQELVKAGVWDYFIFPAIDWEPKGKNINKIISLCHLRAVNVLFVDDNISNRKEAEFYNPGLMTLDINDIGNLLSDEALKGKDDKALSRLHQYKILENKEFFKTSCSDNTEFLIKSNIKIEYIADIRKHSSRVAELIARTNQLNFTKKRIGEDDLLNLIDNSEYELSAIRVFDNFGDYGICGFYALNKKNNVLEHFLFSCRILNLGVENFVYQQLGCPKLNIVEQVSEEINPNKKIDWIDIVPTTDNSSYISSVDIQKKHKIKILLMGGCDLDQLVQYIDPSKFEVITDFNYVNNLGVPVHRDSLCYIKDSYSLSDDHKKIVQSLPFNDSQLFDYNFTKTGYDVVVYSVLVNYTQVLYRHRKYGFLVSYGGYDDITKKKSERGFTKEKLIRFKQEYECVGQLTPEDFKNDLSMLLNKTNKPIVFLNGAEVDYIIPEELIAPERHKAMNQMLDMFISEHSDRCGIVDVRKIVKSKTDCTNCIRHYKRVIYAKLAIEIMDEVIKRVHVLVDFRGNSYIYKIFLEKYLRDIFRKIFRKSKKILNLLYNENSRMA